jgi:hypothetical protein
MAYLGPRPYSTNALAQLPPPLLGYLIAGAIVLTGLGAVVLMIRSRG